LLAVVSYRLQDGSQCFDLNSNIKQMGSKEEIVEVAQNGEGKVPQAVQECLKFAQKK
jgi:type II secretory pathway component PulK